MRIDFLLPTAVVLGLVATAAGASDRIELPPGPNRDLVYGKCRVCHDLQYVVDSAGITKDNWIALIEDMGRYGLRIPPEVRDKIVEYLITYLGPNPPKAAAPAAPAAPIADGKAAYVEQCSSCHQPDGMGIDKNFPPLAGNHDLFLDRLFPVYVVLNGLEGPATIKGKHFQGAMPPFDHLRDAEVAAIVNYVRGAWSNEKLRPAGFVDVDEAAVAAARRTPMKPTEVHAYRAARQ